jgi:hypothetical protein
MSFCLDYRLDYLSIIALSKRSSQQDRQGCGFHVLVAHGVSGLGVAHLLIAHHIRQTPPSSNNATYRKRPNIHKDTTTTAPLRTRTASCSATQTSAFYTASKHNLFIRSFHLSTTRRAAHVQCIVPMFDGNVQNQCVLDRPHHASHPHHAFHQVARPSPPLHSRIQDPNSIYPTAPYKFPLTSVAVFIPPSPYLWAP